VSGSNRTILLALPLLALVAAVYLLVIAPKRQEAADLESKAVDLQSQVAATEQAADAAEAARKDFPRAYQRLVVLGKATPTDDDTASLLVQLEQVAERADVEFMSLEVQQGDGATAPTPAAEPQTPADTAAADEQRVESVGDENTQTPAPPTEASAASLPIGATVGPAGLPVMKYNLRFEGDFYSLSKYIDGVDDFVTTANDGHVGVRGRLITIDGFELTPQGGAAENPNLTAELQITTYVTPADQGATGGASPTGPAPATEPQAVAAPAPDASTETASTNVP
jgi:hypothetical protein